MNAFVKSYIFIPFGSRCCIWHFIDSDKSNTLKENDIKKIEEYSDKIKLKPDEITTLVHLLKEMITQSTVCYRFSDPSRINEKECFSLFGIIFYKSNLLNFNLIFNYHSKGLSRDEFIFIINHIESIKNIARKEQHR